MLKRMRLLMAGVVAFIVGVPLTEKAYGQVGDVIFGSLDLAGAIIDASDGS